MGNALVYYEAARNALAKANKVDEVKTVRDKASAMQLYARQAKDRELIDYATEIRMRAEIRSGELLREMQKNKGRRGQLKGDVPVGGRAPQPPTDTAPTLSDIGVTKDQSHRWQKLASLPKQEQEAKIALAKKSAADAIDAATVRRNGANGHKQKEPTPTILSLVERNAGKIRKTIVAMLKTFTVSEREEFIAALRYQLDDLERRGRASQ